MSECKKSTLVTELEDKIRNVQEQHGNHIKRLTEIKESLNKLKSEEERTVQQLSVLVGSYNAYQDSLKSINVLDNDTSKE
jgi:hypothetical protein